MSSKLYYCNTVYSCKPPSDINPLILQKYKGKSILVLCCRDGQMTRIDKLALNNVYHYGWWKLKDIGFVDEDGYIDYEELDQWDLVVILDKKRIQEIYLPLHHLNL